jgi:hypothetical protein
VFLQGAFLQKTARSSDSFDYEHYERLDYFNIIKKEKVVLVRGGLEGLSASGESCVQP